MLGRIDPVLAAGQYRDGPAFETGAMRRCVDAARQPGDNGEAGLAEFVRDPLGEFQPAPEALREPTIATIGSDSTRALPRTAISGGASSIIRKRGG